MWRRVCSRNLTQLACLQVDHKWKLEGVEERAAEVLRAQLGLQGRAPGRRKKQ